MLSKQYLNQYDMVGISQLLEQIQQQRLRIIQLENELHHDDNRIQNNQQLIQGLQQQTSQIQQVNGQTTIQSGLNQIQISNSGIHISGELSYGSGSGQVIWTPSEVTQYQQLSIGEPDANVAEVHLRTYGTSIFGSLTNPGAVKTYGNFDVQGSTTLNGPTTLNGSTTLNGQLNLNGSTTLNGPVNLSSTLNVAENTSLQKDLIVNGSATVQGSTTLNGSTALNSTLNVAENTSLQKDLIVNGPTALNGSTQMNSTLNVAENTSLQKDLTVNGQTQINSTLNVAENTSLQKDLIVQGSTALNSTLNVAENTSLQKDLTVNGQTTLNGSTILNGNLDVQSIPNKQQVLNVLTGSQTDGQYLRSNGTNSILSNIDPNDIKLIDPITMNGGQKIQSCLNSLNAAINNVKNATAWRTCEVQATENIDVNAPTQDVFDSIQITSGQSLFLNSQTDKTQNGAYIFNGIGNPLTRDPPTTNWDDLISDNIVVQNGSTFATFRYFCTSQPGGILGTNEIQYAIWNTLYNGGQNISVNGNQISVTGIVPIEHGGTNSSTKQEAINTLVQDVSSQKYLRGDGTNVLMSSIQVADVPILNQNTTGTSSMITGIVPVEHGGTNSSTKQEAINTLVQDVSNQKYLRGDGTNVQMSSIQIADVPILNQNTTGTSSMITGIVPVEHGGTNSSTKQEAIDTLFGTTDGYLPMGDGLHIQLTSPQNVIDKLLSPTLNDGKYLRCDGTNSTLSAIDPSDIRLIDPTNLQINQPIQTCLNNLQTSSTTVSLQTSVTGILPIEHGGTNSSTKQEAINTLVQDVSSQKYLRGDGTNVSMSSIQVADVPILNQNTTGTSSMITGIVPVEHGGTNSSTIQDAIDTLVGSQSNRTFLRSDGTNVSMKLIDVDDVPILNQNTTGTSSMITGIVPIEHGGTNSSTKQGAINTLFGTTDGYLPMGNGTNIVMTSPENVMNKLVNPGLMNNVLVSDGTKWSATSIESMGIQEAFNGILNTESISMSYSASRTVTISGEIHYYLNGKYYTDSPGSIVHPSITGLHYIYYNESNVLVATTVPWDLLRHVPLYLIYFNNSTSNGIIYNELHAGGNKGMSPAVHKNLHLTRGTHVLNGLKISQQLGTLTTGWQTTSGAVLDEDLSTQILDVTSYTLFWLSGTQAAPVWNWQTIANNGLYTFSGSNPQYNQLNGTNWQITPITDNRFFNHWIVAIPSLNISGVISIVGQSIYSSLSQAQSATFQTEIQNPTLFMQEGVVLYKIIYQKNESVISVNSVMSIQQSLVAIETQNSFSAAATAIATTIDTANFIAKNNGILTSLSSNVQLAIDGLNNAIDKNPIGNSVAQRDSDGNLNAANLILGTSGGTETRISTQGQSVVNANGQDLVLSAGLPNGTGDFGNLYTKTTSQVPFQPIDLFEYVGTGTTSRTLPITITDSSGVLLVMIANTFGQYNEPQFNGQPMGRVIRTWYDDGFGIYYIMKPKTGNFYIDGLITSGNYIFEFINVPHIVSPPTKIYIISGGFDYTFSGAATPGQYAMDFVFLDKTAAPAIQKPDQTYFINRTFTSSGIFASYKEATSDTVSMGVLRPFEISMTYGVILLDYKYAIEETATQLDPLGNMIMYQNLSVAKNVAIEGEFLLTSSSVKTNNGGTGLRSSGANKNVLMSNGSTWESKPLTGIPAVFDQYSWVAGQNSVYYTPSYPVGVNFTNGNTTNTYTVQVGGSVFQRTVPSSGMYLIHYTVPVSVLNLQSNGLLLDLYHSDGTKIEGTNSWCGLRKQYAYVGNHPGYFMLSSTSCQYLSSGKNIQLRFRLANDNYSPDNITIDDFSFFFVKLY